MLQLGLPFVGDCVVLLDDTGAHPCGAARRWSGAVARRPSAAARASARARCVVRQAQPRPDRRRPAAQGAGRPAVAAFPGRPSHAGRGRVALASLGRAVFGGAAVLPCLRPREERVVVHPRPAVLEPGRSQRSAAAGQGLLRSASRTNRHPGAGQTHRRTRRRDSATARCRAANGHRKQATAEADHRARRRADRSPHQPPTHDAGPKLMAFT